MEGERERKGSEGCERGGREKSEETRGRERESGESNILFGDFQQIKHQ